MQPRRPLVSDSVSSNIEHSFCDKFDVIRGGMLEIIKKDLQGNVIETIIDKNLVVNKAREVVASLLAGQGNSGGELYLTNMAFGRSGHDTFNPVNPIDPTLGDTALNDEILSKPFTSISLTNSTTIRMEAEIGAGEANGEGISEGGLFTSDGTMVARKTWGIISKTSSFTLSFVWNLLL